jgi:hypothetical protein
MGDDDLDITAHQLREEIEKLGDFTKPEKKEEPKADKKEEKLSDQDKDNYLVKSLRKIP